MIYLRYALSELRRRRGRTILTSLGLALGVGLVVAVSALSSGLDRAQAAVLKPLTGVGTDLSVTRPIRISGDPRTAFQKLSPAERAQLRTELGGGRLDFSKLTPGTTFSQTTYRSTQFSVASSTVTTIAQLAHVAAAAGGLTLTMTTISGTVPTQGELQQGRGVGGPPGGFRGNADFTPTTIGGVDETKPSLGALTSGQVTTGRYFTSGAARQAILDVTYATTKDKHVGDTITLGKQRYAVIGIAKTPLGGQSSDVYVKLAQLQQLAGRAGRVNAIYVRADSAGAVDSVAKAIEATVAGASVTTASTLAQQITGSLSTAKDLTQKLGVALELIGLVGAVLIASLLTLTSVTKRIRELGTLKALGWSRRLVVRQVAGESLAQGVLGGAAGVLVGLAGAALITLFAPTLKATVAQAASEGPRFGPFGQGAATPSASESVQLTAHVSLGVVLLAVALAVAGGLVAGATGAFRASRLRPVEALRHID